MCTFMAIAMVMSSVSLEQGWRVMHDASTSPVGTMIVSSFPYLLADYGNAGIPLPVVDGVSLVNPNITFGQVMKCTVISASS